MSAIPPLVPHRDPGPEKPRTSPVVVVVAFGAMGLGILLAGPVANSTSDVQTGMLCFFLGGVLAFGGLVGGLVAGVMFLIDGSRRGR